MLDEALAVLQAQRFRPLVLDATHAESLRILAPGDRQACRADLVSQIASVAAGDPFATLKPRARFGARNRWAFRTKRGGWKEMLSRIRIAPRISRQVVMRW